MPWGVDPKARPLGRPLHTDAATDRAVVVQEAARQTLRVRAVAVATAGGPPRALAAAVPRDAALPLRPLHPLLAALRRSPQGTLAILRLQR